jgi:hypothetical protein
MFLFEVVDRLPQNLPCECLRLRSVICHGHPVLNGTNVRMSSGLERYERQPSEFSVAHRRCISGSNQYQRIFPNKIWRKHCSKINSSITEWCTRQTGDSGTGFAGAEMCTHVQTELVNSCGHTHVGVHKRILIGGLDHFSDQSSLPKALAENVW